MENNNEYTYIPADINTTQLDHADFSDNNRIVLSNNDSIEIYGTEKQRTEMFRDLSLYLGEIKNPENKENNAYLSQKNKENKIDKDVLYAPLDEVLNTTRPVLSKYGFGLIQIPYAKERVAGVRTILTHKSGAFISFPILAVPTAQNTAQQVIAAITYSRRGALNPILATHGEVDDDGNSLESDENTNKQSKIKNTSKTGKTEDKRDLNSQYLPEQNEVINFAKELIKKYNIDKDTISSICDKHNCNPKNCTDKKTLSVVLEELKKLIPSENNRVKLEEIDT